MKQWLNAEQKARLTEVVNEGIRLHSWGGLVKKLGCSIGSISGIHSGKAGVTEPYALYLCKRLGVNPYYVTDGVGPKYKDWHTVFMGGAPR